MPADQIEALTDYVVAQAADREAHYYGDLSMVGLYRLFLRAYGGDQIKARAGFVQYAHGDLPGEVLAYCNRVEKESAS